MRRTDQVWLGVDPGGKGSFGLAILRADGTVQTWCVDCADAAMGFVRQYLSTPPDGVGVDAPLWWSAGPSGDRRADQWLRKTYNLSGGQVQTVNSLRGAALAQGMMFVQQIRELFPKIPVTETHPNALLKALGLTWKSFARRFRVSACGRTKHEHDAVISGVSAREGFSARWKNDLSTRRHPSEQDPSLFWLAPIHYYWPEA